MTIETKRCVSCGSVFPLTSFYTKKENRDGYNNSCKECIKKKSAEYRLKKKEAASLNIEIVPTPVETPKIEPCICEQVSLLRGVIDAIYKWIKGLFHGNKAQ